MTSSRVEEIERRLRSAFEPAELLVKDQSHLHAGHVGAREGKGHFDVRIVSERFEGLRPVARHRLVYEALGNFMQTDIHALSVNAVAPSER